MPMREDFYFVFFKSVYLKALNCRSIIPKVTYRKVYFTSFNLFLSHGILQRNLKLKDKLLL
jgi:hypothetical protein